MRIGTDLVEIGRIERALARRGSRFLGRLLTPAERKAIAGRGAAKRRVAERVGGRFAAKEAVLKLLGTGWGGGLGWRDVEILDTPGALRGGEPRSGEPRVRLSAKAARRARTRGVRGVALSISHEANFALAVAVSTGRPS
ncbi:MAG: holo-ACP synthase [Planctomycetes bacterium]|nr:holo-ACP synthase [Planctomycetota bacterium]